MNLLEVVKQFSQHTEYIVLICFELADYLTGFALALKKHRISSSVNLSGTLTKIVTLAIPLLLYPVFYLYKFDDVFQIFIYSLIIPNVLSLVENLAGFGIKLPDAILKIFDNQPKK